MSWDRLFQDARYGLRMLAKRPGFTAVAVLSLALGIGATTAIFSVVYAVLIDPYPYRASDRIGQIRVTDEKGHDNGISYSMAQYFEVKARAHTMEDMVTFDTNEAVLTGNGLPEVIRFGVFSPNEFEFFGVGPILGRGFSPKDVRQGEAPEPVGVMSYKFWQGKFQGRRDILGTKLHVNNKIYTVIGVLPPRFTWMDIDVYVPMDLRPSTRDRVGVFYRVKPGVTQRQIASEFEPMLTEFKKQSPTYVFPPGRFRVKWVNVNDGILGKFENTLLALLAAVGFLLLIACGNVANLLLARAAAREGEIAVRISLGAGRRRIIEQLLTESVMLSLTGGILGVAFAYGGVRAVIALMPEYSIPHEAVISLNWPVLWFALAVSIATGILFGLAPALQLSSRTHTDAIRSSGRGAVSSTRGQRLHGALMVTEIVLALVLLTGAGLAMRGFLALSGQRLGYDPHNVLTFLLPLPEGRYTTWAQREGFLTECLNRLRRIPHVQSASMMSTGVPPWNGGRTTFVIDGLPAPAGAQIKWNLVSDSYLETVRTPLLRGRTFDVSDIGRASHVGVVSEDLVKRYFPNGQEPIGRHVKVDILGQPIPAAYLKAPGFDPNFEIIGIVGSARNNGLQDPADPTIYLPYTTIAGGSNFGFVRTTGDPLSLANPVREAIRSVDSGEAVDLVRSLEQWLEQAFAYPRFASFLFGVFASVGLFLAAAGVFSVVSYAVAHRTREFGIRMALGARPLNVAGLVLGSTGRVLLVGLVIGVALSIVGSHLLTGKMEGMGTPDPFLFVMVPVVLIVATLLACLLPARSATRIQPMEALRQE